MLRRIALELDTHVHVLSTERDSGDRGEIEVRASEPWRVDRQVGVVSVVRDRIFGRHLNDVGVLGGRSGERVKPMIFACRHFQSLGDLEVERI